jgi:hypothetical protein
MRRQLIRFISIFCICCRGLRLWYILLWTLICQTVLTNREDKVKPEQDWFSKFTSCVLHLLKISWSLTWSLCDQLWQIPLYVQNLLGSHPSSQSIEIYCFKVDSLVLWGEHKWYHFCQPICPTGGLALTKFIPLGSDRSKQVVELWKGPNHQVLHCQNNTMLTDNQSWT